MVKLIRYKSELKRLPLLRVVVFLGVLILMLTTGRGQVRAGSVHFNLNPDTGTHLKDQSVLLKVMLDTNGKYISSGQFTITFDNTKYEAVDVLYGYSVFGLQVDEKLDNTNGFVSVSMASDLSHAGGFKGVGEFATVKFKALVDSGSTQIKFEDVQAGQYENVAYEPVLHANNVLDLSACPPGNYDFAQNNANSPPVAHDDNASVSSGESVDIYVLANDTDADDNLDISTLSITAAPNSSAGSATVNSDGTITYDANSSYAGTDTFTYEICDDLNACDTADVDVTIGQNSPPVAHNDSGTAIVGQSVTLHVTANDTDPDGNLDVSSVSVATLPAKGNAVPADDGSGDVVYTAVNSGADSFEYRVCDTFGLCDTATVSVSNSQATSGPVCGNGVVETGESCDDGNTVGGDGCSAYCSVESAGGGNSGGNGTGGNNGNDLPDSAFGLSELRTRYAPFAVLAVVLGVGSAIGLVNLGTGLALDYSVDIKLSRKSGMSRKI